MFLLANIGLRQSEARYLRMVGRLSLQENRRYLGHSIALLFIKASCVAQDVYSAMHLRGYINQQVRLKELKLSMVDYLFIINSLLILVVIFVIGY